LKKEIIRPEGIAYPSWNYTPAIKCGNTVYCAGTGASDAEGNIVGTEIAAQATQAFRNLEIILKAAGARLSDVVQMRTFLADMERDRAGYMEVRNRFWQQPPGTTIIETGLSRPGLLLQVEAIAVIDDEE
jgi:enamine deaminase RidA (YjgF/YER057c/UK114 family)